ncbi:MAG TPA: hypothetical protein PLT02_13515, partial [Chitinophagaceae bacterium]|nr:hypothetical protein [Chitinophagaceae bacterium]
MKSSALLLSAFVASHSSRFCLLFSILIVSVCLSTNIKAQTDSSTNHNSEFNISKDSSLKAVLENAMPNNNIIRNY